MKGSMSKTLLSLTVAAIVAGAGSGSAAAQSAKAAVPSVPLEQLLAGHFNGSGEFVDKRGGKDRGIDLDIRGSYDAKAGTLTLAEDTLFSDGEKQHKVWIFTRKTAERWTGTRSDVIGEADITIDGSAIRMVYKAHVPRDGKIWDLKFDERYTIASPDLIQFRADVSYLFFTVGEATLTIRRAGR